MIPEELTGITPESFPDDREATAELLALDVGELLFALRETRLGIEAADEDMKQAETAREYAAAMVRRDNLQAEAKRIDDRRAEASRRYMAFRQKVGLT